jgi:guanylate kinase
MTTIPKRGLAFIISAPAGTGKNTLVHRLVEEFPTVVEAVSCTTRQPRPGEHPGHHYDFISRELFEQRIAEGAFLEHAQLFGNLYGTLRDPIERERDQGRHVVLVIDTQGAMLLKEKYDAINIFIAPPSLAELEHRLRSRQTDDEESIGSRLAEATRELSVAEQYDYLIVNDQVDEAYQVLRAIFIAEDHKVRKR